jgi:CRP/FNR family cyclic AMP-dependent transcriptional regulator
MMKAYDLSECSVFKGIDQKYLDEILSSCERIELKQGEFLFHQDESGDAMYVVESGELQVILNQDGANSKRVIETLKSGALVGELCVFGHQKRSASIYASVDANLIKIEGEDFRVRVYSKELDALLICYNIANLLADRLRATNSLLTFILNNGM